MRMRFTLAAKRAQMMLGYGCSSRPGGGARESLTRPFTGALFSTVLEAEDGRAAQQVGQGAHHPVAAQAK